MLDRLRRPISQLLQFALLLAPVVMTCFYFVYALVGFFIDGSSKMRWDEEAQEVGLGVLGLVLGYCAFSLFIVWVKRGGLYHPVTVSSFVHGIIAICLTALIFANS